MANKFISIMEAIGKDTAKIWAEVMKYMPAAVSLAALIFPPQAATIAGVVNSVDLIQQAVATVEQKFKAAGAPSGSGPQKLAQVASMVSPTVIELLSKENVPIDQTRVTNIVNAVVAVLNAQEVPAAA